MLDLTPIRAYIRATTTVAITGEEVHTHAIEASEITHFVCIDHPEFLWKGTGWDDVLAHLVTHHAGTSENGKVEAEVAPFHSETRASDHVQVGIEPPAAD